MSLSVRARMRQCVCGTHLNSQGYSVEQNENEHDIFKSCRVDDGPELVLDRILRNVQFERLSL